MNYYDPCHDTLAINHAETSQTCNFHQLLDELGLAHWFMYGSLVGAVRVRASRPLAWDKNIDIGLDGDNRLKQPSKILLIQTKFFENLKSVGATKVSENWFRDGVNLRFIMFENSEFSVDLMIFHRSEKWIKRQGWAARTFFNFTAITLTSFSPTAAVINPTHIVF